MSDLIEWLFGAVYQIVAWALSFGKAVVRAIWDMLSDVACWVFDQGMSLAISMASYLDISALEIHMDANIASATYNVMNLLGIQQVATIIVAAIGVRLLLQLIPFTRLGS